MKNYFDERVKLDHRIQGVVNGMSEDIAASLEEAHVRLTGKVMVLGVKSGDARTLARKRFYLEKQRSEIEKVLGEVYEEIGRGIESQAVALGQASPEIMLNALRESVPPGYTLPSLEMPHLTKASVESWFRSFQVEGQFFPAYLQKLESNTAARIVAASKQMLISPGTARETYKALQQATGAGRHGLEALTSTALHGAATFAEHETALENKGIIRHAEWVVELDRKTCAECAVLDKQVFAIGDIPELPPIHLRCRCWLHYLPLVEHDGKMVPLPDVLAEEGFEEQTDRIARIETSPRKVHHRDGTTSTVYREYDVKHVDRRTSYSDWMQSMATSKNAADRAFAKEALGPTRFRLVESGKLRVNSLYYGGKLRTIDELKGLMK